MAEPPQLDVKVKKGSVSEAIHVYLGSTEVRFVVDRALICSHSEFIEKLLGDKNNQHSQEGKIYLRKDDPQAFQMIVTWLEENKVEDLEDVDDEILYVKSFILASKLMIESFQSKIAEAIKEFYSQQDNLIGVSTFRRLGNLIFSYETPLGGPLGELYVSEYVRQILFQRSEESKDMQFDEEEFEYIAGGGPFASMLASELLEIAVDSLFSGLE